MVRILRSAGLSRIASLDPPPPARYEHDESGSLILLDIKKLGLIIRPGKRVTGAANRSSKGAGWERLHICIDDHSGLSYADVLPDETKESASGLPRRALRFLEHRSVRVRRGAHRQRQLLGLRPARHRGSWLRTKAVAGVRLSAVVFSVAASLGLL